MLSTISDRDSDIGFKGSIFRGYMEALRRWGAFDAVLAHVDPSTRAMMEYPPASTGWLDFRHCERVVVAVEEIQGPGSARRLGRESMAIGVAPLTKNMLEGLLRLFGATPATIFSRLPQFAKLSTRGFEHRYESTSATTGVLEMSIRGRSDVPNAVWESSAGSLELTFEACGTTGTISAATVRRDRDGETAAFIVEWKPRR